MEGSARILVIDDDAQLRRAYGRLLGRAGYEVLVAATGKEGLQSARTLQPDLILLDVMLPDTNGIELCCCIKADEALDGTYVVLLSGHKTASEDRVGGLEAGADGYIVRPVSNRELLARVRAILRTRQVALALGDSEGKLRALFEVLPVGVSVLDAERNILDVNPALGEILDLSREQLLDAEYVERKYLRPDGSPMPADEFPSTRVVREDRPIRDVEIGIEKEDGDVIWVSVSAVPAALADWQVVINTVDITRRKEVEEALRRERDLLERLMETNPVGIVVIDGNGRVTFANPQAEQILGLTKRHITGLTYNAPEWRITDFDGDPIPDHRLPFRQVMDTERPVRGVRCAVTWANGRRVMLSVNGAPLSDDTGRTDGVILTLEDVTQLVREARQQSEALKQELEALAFMSSPSGASETALSFGAEPLHRSLPNVFGELVHRYQELIELAFEQNVYKVEHAVSESLRAVARQLSSLRAGPRDVMDLHTAALQNARSGRDAIRSQVYAVESRLLALELMGYLAAHYRRLSMGSGSRPVPDALASEGER